MVADGLGAYRGAHLASQSVTAYLCSLFEGEVPTEEKPFRHWIQKGLASFSWSFGEGQVDRTLRNMASTLSLLHFQNNHYLIAQVGDSRAYLLREGTLIQITQDHSVAFEQFLAGAITKEDLPTHPNQKLVTRIISGGKKFIIADIFSGVARPGDRFLLCTDGLIKGLRDREIGELLLEPLSGEELMVDLVKYAQLGGSTDDITAVVVEVKENCEFIDY